MLTLADHPALRLGDPDPWARTLDEVFGARLYEYGVQSVAGRDILQRRRYAGDPWAYMRDVLGWLLTPQQDGVIELLEHDTRVLIPSANNVGKTFVLSAYGVYVMDAVASLPDPENGLAEQGARVLLPGPDHDTVFETIYSEMLTHAARAESRGYLMPGIRSDRSVLWRVRPKWHVEVLTPPRRVNQAVAHTASGRHHRNQIALIEEGQGVEEPLWRAAEGMCSSEGNKIASSFNPTEPIGPAYQRSRTGAYRVKHLDAFEHPNVIARRGVIPDAVDVKVIDARVRSDCRDRGPAFDRAGVPLIPMDPTYGDFLYALPPLELTDAERAADQHARDDGILGSPLGVPHVYRSTSSFVAQVRGQWPTTSDAGLFSVADVDAAVTRWRMGADPASPPDRVGLDPSREGDDEPVACPSWGETADALITRYAAAQLEGPAAIAAITATGRIRCGDCVVFARGDGPDVALQAHRRFPASPFVVDEGGVSTSPLDHLARVLRRQVAGVSFSAKPLRVLPDEPWSENMRTQLYVRAAMLVRRGLVDIPDDPLLREELLAHETWPKTRSESVFNPSKGREEKIRVPSVALIEKDEIKKRIGRSPDRADAWVLSLFAPAPRAPKPLLHGTISRRTLGV